MEPDRSEAAQPFLRVLADEVRQLRSRREQLPEAERDVYARAIRPTEAETQATSKTHLDPAIVSSQKLRTFGLCLSGGGIRSATFNLGVLQGFCKQGLLPYVDYLSTVSGGGYIGTWLHGVIRDKNAGNPVNAQTHLLTGRKPGEPTFDPVSFLRKYSNYLAPHVGIFSADTWAIAGVWTRNMGLNLLIMIPFLAFLVTVTRIVGIPLIDLGKEPPLYWWSWAPALLVAAIIVSLRLLAIVDREFKPKWPFVARMAERVRSSEGWGKVLASNGMVWVAVCLSMLAACILSMTAKWALEQPWWITFGILLVLFVMHQAVGGFYWCFGEQHEGQTKWGLVLVVVIALVCSTVTSGMMFVTWRWLASLVLTKAWIPVTFGPALMILVWVAGIGLQIGLMGADFPDTAREWLAQFGSLLAIVAVGWTAVFTLSIYGPFWLVKITIWKAKAGLTAVGGWITSGLASYFAGASSKTKGPAPAKAKNTSLSLETLASVAPPVFMVLTLVLVAFGTHLAVRRIVSPPAAGCFAEGEIPQDWRGQLVEDWRAPLVKVRDDYWYYLRVADEVSDGAPCWPVSAGRDASFIERRTTTPMNTTVTLGILLAIQALLLSLRFNINEFSMHHFYKNRLVRCYLGAGNAADRVADRLTGFDPKDDFKLCSLVAKQADAAQEWKPYLGPYPILNCTLNLNTGSELATAERKAASFVFTPQYCGFEPVQSRVNDGAPGDRDGYRATKGYMSPKGPNIGTAMAISGAAANPNSGFHTSTPLAFLLTIFNVRLGWWVGNPRRANKSKRSGPLLALPSLLSELFAITDSYSAYVNLSDGGHFENLGLYELVRRRCRYVIASDAEEDPNYSFEALGSAIRKCRADFGVEITIDLDSIRPGKDRPMSKGHCVVGRIRYPEPDHGGRAKMCEEAKDPDPERTDGWLVYFKSSLTGDEPEDVQQYRVNHPVFPHEPTSNQFFTESQFESYRRLGEHVVDSTFGRVMKLSDFTTGDPILSLFQDLYRKWHPVAGQEKSGNYTERYASLMQKLGADADLAFLGSQFFGVPASNALQSEAGRRKAFFYCLEVIQLMEDVYFDLGFASDEVRYSPSYGGWMKTFHRWKSSEELRKSFEIARETYNLLFQRFFDSLEIKKPI